MRRDQLEDVFKFFITAAAAAAAALENPNIPVFSPANSAELEEDPEPPVMVIIQSGLIPANIRQGVIEDYESFDIISMLSSLSSLSWSLEFNSSVSGVASAQGILSATHQNSYIQCTLPTLPYIGNITMFIYVAGGYTGRWMINYANVAIGEVHDIDFKLYLPDPSIPQPAPDTFHYAGSGLNSDNPTITDTGLSGNKIRSTSRMNVTVHQSSGDAVYENLIFGINASRTVPSVILPSGTEMCITSNGNIEITGLLTHHPNVTGVTFTLIY